jgi:hypothetical protein
MSESAIVDEKSVVAFLTTGLQQFLDENDVPQDAPIRARLKNRELFEGANFQARALQALTEIAKSKANQAGGELSARIGSVHLPLKKMAENAAKTAFFSGLAATVEPTGMSAAAAGISGLELLEDFSCLINKLSPTEIMIYDAAAYIDSLHAFMPSISTTMPRGTRVDLQKIIKKRGFDVPNDFDDALVTAVQKGAIKMEKVEYIGQVYHAVK